VAAQLAQQSAAAFLSPSSRSANTGEKRKTRKPAFNWKQFPFRAKYLFGIMGESAAPNLPLARQQRIQLPAA
jgi:hypothetical protein